MVRKAEGKGQKAEVRNKSGAAIVLVVFAIVFSALSVGSYRQKSAAWDEPVHMSDAYASLIQHDYRIDPEHPPFVRMWAALPLMAMQVVPFDLSILDKMPPGQWARTLYQSCTDFLYTHNDADHLLSASRFMIVLLGVALGALVFLWAQAWLGFRPAVVALACYTLEPNIAAHASLVTTDMGLACFLFATVYFLWRTSRSASPANVAGLLISFALAVISKFSAIALLPIVVVLLAWSVWRRQAITPAKAAGLFALMIVAGYIAIWAVYGFRYAPSATPGWLYDFGNDTQVVSQVPTLARLIGWIDAHHLLPNSFSQGFLFGQAKAVVRRSFLLGEFSASGWWYYFPVAFAIKTPIGILLLLGIGAVAAVRRAASLGVDAVMYVAVPLVVYLALSMTTHLNIGLRHLLPVYPFVMLFAGVAAKALLESRAKAGAIVLAALVAGTALEFGRTYPDNLAFFNAAVGGPDRGGEYLTDSNLDWGQDLKPLKRWMDLNGVSSINLAYFGTALPQYYKMDVTYLPGSTFVPGEVKVNLPGYVAISATVLNGVYLDNEQRAFYSSFRSRTPVARVGHTILVYWVDKQWW
jgi:hypothetical protein